MTNNFIRIMYLSRKLTHNLNNAFDKGEETNDRKEMFMRVWFNSLPVVYPSFDEWYKEFNKLYKSRIARKKRISKYIRGMFASYHQEKLFFLTFTFSEKAMKAKEQTRKDYVRKYLNANCYDYIANQDFGDKTNREHYHAVVASDYIKTDFVGGHVHFKHIRTQNANRLAKYQSKLTNHAQKVTCGKVFHKRGLVEVDELPF